MRLFGFLAARFFGRFLRLMVVCLLNVTKFKDIDVTFRREYSRKKFAYTPKVKS